MLLVLSAVALLAQPGGPADPSKGQETVAAVAAATPPEEKAGKPKRICRAEAVLGSRLPVTLCATSAEWEARRVKDKEKLDAIQHAIRNPNPGDP